MQHSPLITFPRINFTPLFPSHLPTLLPTPSSKRRIRNGVCEHQTAHNSSSLLLIPPHTYSVLQNETFPWLQSFRINLFSMASLQATVPSRNIYLLWCWVSQRLQCGYLLWHGLLHRLQENLCSGTSGVPTHPPFCLLGSAVHCSRASWNQLCLTQGSPGLSSQRPALHPLPSLPSQNQASCTQHRHLVSSWL